MKPVSWMAVRAAKAVIQKQQKRPWRDITPRLMQTTERSFTSYKPGTQKRHLWSERNITPQLHQMVERSFSYVPKTQKHLWSETKYEMGFPPVVKQAHRLLEEFEKTRKEKTFKPELWMEAEDCLWQLSNDRTPPSVDLSFLLLEELLREKQELGHDAEMECTKFLSNWQLWHSVLINWQKVSQEELRVSKTGDIEALTSEQLYDQLGRWEKMLATEKRPGISIITSKALSVLMDIASRRGRVKVMMSESRNGTTPEIIEIAEFVEKLFDLMIEHGNATTNAFPPSTANLNSVLSLWAKIGLIKRARNVLNKAILANIEIDRHSYNAILAAYAATGNGAAAEQILQDLYSADSVITPDIVSWNTVMAAWSKHSDKQLAAQRVEQILHAMMHSSDEKQYDDDAVTTFDPLPVSSKAKKNSFSIACPGVRPDLSTFNSALATFARIGAAERCDQLLSEMKEWHQDGRLQQRPDMVSYTTVLNAFAKAGRPDKAEALSDEMYSAFMVNADTELKPSIPMFTTILDAYMRTISDENTIKDKQFALSCLARAEKVFHRMRELHNFAFLPSGPDTAACNAMLTCYLRSSAIDTFPIVNRAAEKADGLLKEMKQMAQPYARGNLSFDQAGAPDFKSYSIVIQLWLQRPRGVDRALQLLDEVWNMQKDGNPRMRPDSLSLHFIIVQFCRAGKPGIAERLLMNICDAKSRDPSSFVEPRMGSFGAILSAWTQSAHPNSPRIAHDFVRRVERLYDLGIISQGPDYQMYKLVVQCWSYSKLKGAADKAYSILEKMRYCAAKGDKSMQPHSATYTQVMHAFANHRVNPLRAETVLREMYDDYQKGIQAAKPDIKSFNTVLSAWARYNHPYSVDRAEALFREMQRLHDSKKLDIKCDVVTYNSLLSCLAQSAGKDKAERAEDILKGMKEMAKAGNTALRPTVETYGCIIKAWVRAGEPSRAEAALSEMYEQFMKGSPNMKPQPRHFDNVEQSWSISSSDDGKAKARAVRDLKKELYPIRERNEPASNEEVQ